jgi:lipopolysaccharide export system permease protein
MRWKRFAVKKTITRYIVREMLGPFCLGIMIFTFVLLMDQVLELVELVVNKGVKLISVLELLMYFMPSLLVLSIPMAVLVATLTAFGRLSTDSEITAMKASGLSLHSLFSPVLLFSLIACVTTFFVYAKALPWGNYQFRVKSYELARTKAAVALKAQVFDRTFPGLDIYIDEISDRDSSFTGIMISDARDPRSPQTIFAKRGRLISDEDALRVILHLEEGSSHPKYADAWEPKYQVVEFPALDILLSLQPSEDQGGNIPLTDREMTIPQLVGQYTIYREHDLQKNVPKQQLPTSPPKPVSLSALPLLLRDSVVFSGRLSSRYLVELHKRFSFPFACLVFGLIGTPLGIQSRRAGKSGGYAVSLGLLMVYYIFIAAGESLGDRGRIPAFFAVWTPNILLGLAGFWLLMRESRR